MNGSGIDTMHSEGYLHTNKEICTEVHIWFFVVTISNWFYKVELDNCKCHQFYPINHGFLHSYDTLWIKLKRRDGSW